MTTYHKILTRTPATNPSRTPHRTRQILSKLTRDVIYRRSSTSIPNSSSSTLVEGAETAAATLQKLRSLIEMFEELPTDQKHVKLMVRCGWSSQ